MGNTKPNTGHFIAVQYISYDIVDDCGLINSDMDMYNKRNLPSKAVKYVVIDSYDKSVVATFNSFMVAKNYLNDLV
jgi:hypothetical protein